MSIESDVRKKMTEALKCGDKESRTVYSTILNAIKNKEKDMRCDSLTDEQETEVIIKLAKQNQESIESCPSSRDDILSKLKFERDIIIQYMPKQMTEAEIKESIEIVLSELGIGTANTPITPKDRGRVMKILMPRVRGRADGRAVNTVLSQYFGN